MYICIIIIRFPVTTKKSQVSLKFESILTPYFTICRSPNCSALHNSGAAKQRQIIMNFISKWLAKSCDELFSLQLNRFACCQRVWVNDGQFPPERGRTGMISFPVCIGKMQIRKDELERFAFWPWFAWSSPALKSLHKTTLCFDLEQSVKVNWDSDFSGDLNAL